MSFPLGRHGQIKDILNKLSGEIFFATNMLIWKFEYEKIGFLVRKNLTFFLITILQSFAKKNSFTKLIFQVFVWII